MVNTLSHLGIGLLIASVAGLNSRQIKVVAFMAILPDLDFILSTILLAVDEYLSHGVYNAMYYLMGHREFMHSLTFASIVIIYVWLRERDRLLTIASAAAIFSHVYLDYVTSWKMRPFFPFVTEATTIGAIDFFDPVVTVISFVPMIYILADRVKRNGIRNGSFKGGNGWFETLTSGSHSKMYRQLLIIFTVWCLFNPLAKAFLISAIEDAEGHDIGYQGSYPISPGKFLSAYQYNETHYRILTSSYWSGVEQSSFVPIYPDSGSEFSPYVSRARSLYDASLPGEVDYQVYSAYSSGANVTVIISDARNPYAQYWAYFKTEYVFVFDTDTGDYKAYIGRHGQHDRPVSRALFE
ncbi:metal-dependent hydrolase [Methanolobus sp. WCC4]|uniref:metal-dependent hydrolase n=1 Tax=Methanolobus sp. WCC4 TaxID=3125784 RepID=UPI0030F9A701